MRCRPKAWSLLTPVLAITATGAAGSGGDEQPERAIALDVDEAEDSVAIEIVAQSRVAQRVEYEIELIGSSRSRHRGSTTVPANEKSVLSRLRTGYSDGWCATVAVTEGDGTNYTLTAGDCGPTRAA